MECLVSMLQTKISDARPLLVQGRTYNINPFPSHMPGRFVQAKFLGPVKNMQGREYVPPQWQDVWDFSACNDKYLYKVLDGFYTALPGWRDFHSKAKLMPIDGNGLIEINEKELCY